MSSSTKTDMTLPPDWQWVTRVHELARGDVVCKLWWRNGVPDFRATVSKDLEGQRPGCIARVEVTYGEVNYGSRRTGQKLYTMRWLNVGAIEDLPYDPLSAAAVVELEINDWLRNSRYLNLSIGNTRRWPDCQPRPTT